MACGQCYGRYVGGNAVWDVWSITRVAEITLRVSVTVLAYVTVVLFHTLFGVPWLLTEIALRILQYIARATTTIATARKHRRERVKAARYAWTKKFKS